MTDHFRKLQNMYQGAAINQIFKSTLEVGDGSAAIILPLDVSFNHAFGSAHGAVYFKLLDDAAYFAAASLVEDRCIVTVSFSIQLIKAAASGVLSAEGHVVSNAGRILVAESQIVDDSDDLVAIGHGTFARSGQRLSDVEEYRL
ncbi:MAG: PaaI family thioesterase [Rhodothermales bacterium]|nr:PaaI family thioesterase [Rhodothermales bacterium]